MAATIRIVLAYAAVGSGHRIAAESVARELEKLAGDRVAVDVVDALPYGSLRPSGDSLTSAFTGSSARLYDAMWSSSAFGRVVEAS